MVAASGKGPGPAISAVDQQKNAELYNLDRVVFLDVDGVLHPAFVQYIRQQFRPTNMKLLKEKDLRGQEQFLKDIYQCVRIVPISSGSRKRFRTLLDEANLKQLRVLVKIAAAVVLKQLPSSVSVRRTLNLSKRKTHMKKLFGSQTKAKRLLRSATPAILRTSLLYLSPVLGALLSVLFQ